MPDGKTDFCAHIRFTEGLAARAAAEREEAKAAYRAARRAARAAIAAGYREEGIPRTRHMLDAGMPEWMVRAMQQDMIGNWGKDDESRWAAIQAYAASGLEI